MIEYLHSLQPWHKAPSLLLQCITLLKVMNLGRQQQILCVWVDGFDVFCRLGIKVSVKELLIDVIAFNMNYFYQQNLNNSILIGENMKKESKSCHTCQRQTYNLLNATCGHKICFHCVKSNKYSHKCASCLAAQAKYKQFLSPSRNVSQQGKERSTKIKDSEPRMKSQYSPSPQPHTLMKSRPSVHRASVEKDEAQQHIQSLPQTIACKEHHQPLSMYCKSAKQLICSVCLCNRAKYGDVMPIRLAQQQLRKENRMNRQQCKIILGNIENASKIINKNQDIFQNTLNSSLQSIQSFFNQIRKEAEVLENKVKQEIKSFFTAKMNEFREISTDLDYLSQILKQFKESNKQNCSFTELLYLFSSFKVIKTTIKNLNLDYLPYSKEPNIVQISKVGIKQFFKGSIRLKLDLPLKIGENRKVKSHSNKSVNRSRNEEWDEIQRGGFTGKMGKEQRGSITKKHQMSLCNNNIHGMQIGEQQRNMYKMLLKAKFKL